MQQLFSIIRTSCANCQPLNSLLQFALVKPEISMAMELSLTSAVPILLLLLPLLCLLFFRRETRKQASSDGLKAYPIIGTLPHFVKNQDRLIEWSADVVSRCPTHTMFFNFKGIGLMAGAITANPANVEYIAKTNFQNYPKGEFVVSVMADFLGHGIFNSDGDQWLWQRKASSYEFNKRSLRNFVVSTVRFEAVERLLPLLSRAELDGLTLDMQDVLERFAFDNICCIAFDEDPACLTEVGLGANGHAEFMHALNDAQIIVMARFMSPVKWAWRIKKLLNIEPERRMSEAVATIHGYVNRIIRERSERGEAGLARKDDFLSRFISSGEHSDESLRDVVTNFILAGRDTTSSALTWFFWLLSNQHEVSYSAYAMARLEEIWGNDCMEYRPERWLDEEGVFRPESSFKYPIFHAGPRMCLGKEMAYIQMKSIVACVLERKQPHADGLKVYPIVGTLPHFIKNQHHLLEWSAGIIARCPTHTMFFNFKGLGLNAGAITANPANVEYIVKSNFQNYPKGEFVFSVIEDLLGHGIFNSDGDQWLSQRKAASYEFSKRSLRNFVVSTVRFEVIERLLPLLSQAERDGRTLDVQDVLERFTFDNICRVAFNEDPACLTEEGLGVNGPAKFMRALNDAQSIVMARLISPVNWAWRIKKLLNMEPERRMREALATIHGYVDRIVHERREKGTAGLAREDDFLSHFASSEEHSEESLRDVVTNFIVAGRDTTSSALTWFFWMVSGRHEVSYSSYAMARLEEIWGKDCAEFRPERWLDEEGAFRPVSPFKYTIFHAGPRMCLGKEMAYIQMKSIVACVLERFRLLYIGGDRQPGLVFSLTLRMEGGLPMQVKKRDY
ncbi:hypothetical protein QYE76_055924 [Lolium multiflorum]|uniref:Cytochrome P450 n=1 Tax=Lolium multiflorum TaxID=4521 RepID=A0AAD8WPX9_LOLMU|nr:hypothetical protein QYE76_055924 [Lolium multiflorum]